MSFSDEPTKYIKKRGRKVRRPKFGIECRFAWGGDKIQPKQKWGHWKWYETRGRRDKALEGLKTKGNRYGMLKIEFRAKER